MKNRKINAVRKGRRERGGKEGRKIVVLFSSLCPIEASFNCN
jgi:hypothetical protein